MITRRACWIGGLVVFAAAFVYFASYAEYGLAYDEGYLLDGVERILDGQVIYRDFHHTYAPGRFYAVAAAFSLFGRSILVERFVFVFLQALKCSLAFLIVAALTGSPLALLAPVLLMLAPGPWHKVFFSSLGFLALYAMIISLRSRPRRLVLTGIVIGACAVFRQDVAGFAVIAGVIGMAIDAIGKEGLWGCRKSRLRQGAEKRGNRCLSPFLQRVLYLLLGLAIVGVPVLLYFRLQGALGAMIQKLTREGMIDNMTNRIAYPSLTAVGGVDQDYLAHVLPVQLVFYLPFVAYALALVFILRRAVGGRWTTAMTPFVVVLAVSMLAFNQSVWRSDLGHLLQSLQYVFLLIAALAAFASSGLDTRRQVVPWLRTVVRLVLVAAVPALLIWASVGIVKGVTDRDTMARFRKEGVSIRDSEYLGSVAVRVGNDTRLNLEKAPVYVSAGEARCFTAIGDYLDRHTAPGDYVLAVPQLQMLYFFYDRRNPTRYAHYRRALDPEEETRYIEDIRSHGTEYIFLTEPFKGARLGETKQSFSEYAGRVRDYLLADYALVERIGSVQILRRRP